MLANARSPRHGHRRESARPALRPDGQSLLARLVPRYAGLSLVAGLIALAWPSLSAAQTFPLTLSLPTGSGPVSVATGDLNGDGNPDLVTANYWASTISVLLGSGGGGFGPQTDFAVGVHPRCVALGDLDGDGHLDVVAANEGSNTVSVLLGTGSGSFGAKTDYATGSSPYWVAICDLSGNGKPDLAVANYGVGTVSVLLGTGSGGFGARTDHATGTNPMSVAIGDLNGDGKPDLAVASSGSNAVSVLLATGSGGFGAKTDYATGLDPYGIALGDLNADGKLDLAVANMSSFSTSVLLGTGTGSFATKTDYDLGGGVPYGLAIGDLTGDGWPDLAVANRGASLVQVLVASGGGSFGTRSDYAAGGEPYAVAIGDLNTDGKLDLAVASFGSNRVSLLLAAGAGGFGPKADFTTGSNPYSVAVGDVSNDGNPDLAVANQSSSTVSVLLGDGTGGFGPKTDFATGSDPRSVAIGDLNADGKPDLSDFATGSYPFSVAIGDVNSDGEPDLAVANRGSNTVSILLALEATQASLASTPNPSTTGAAVTLTATVAMGPPLTGTPTGTVSFFDGFTLLGTQTLSSGTASITAFPSALGSHPLTAVYGGTSRLLGAISAPDMQAVNPVSGSPVITSVRDVPNDEGGKVKLSWNASPLDGPPEYTIASYWILRSVPPNLMAEALACGARLLDGPAERPAVGARSFIVTHDAGVEYAWEYVGSQAAFHSASYSYLAPTACDSVGGSNPLTAFMVQGRNEDGSQWWFSAPDSGYSVDNLSPVPPGPFTGQYAGGIAQLHWYPNPEPDLAGYRLYRGTSAGFVPGPSNLVAARADTGYTDVAGAPYYYRLSALDIHGNESGFVLLLPAGATDVAGEGLLAFALDGVRPNPARGGALTVSFSLPDGASATLELLDVSGRRVAGREVGALGAGRHAVDLAAGRHVPPGLYFVRLSRGGIVRATRVAVLD
jgi:hypothetical protein